MFVLILFLWIPAAAWSLPGAPAAGHPETAGRKCVECHADVMKHKQMHAPVAGEMCEACHVVPAAGGKTSFTASGGALCESCHEQYSGKFVHGPVAVGACVACHDPHGTDFPKLVRSEGVTLCFNCHTEMEARIDNARFRHAALDSGCTSCHDPHASNYQFQLIAQPPELCGTCHADVLEQARTAAVKHPPVMEGRSCLNCHDPHAADERPQLKADTMSLCLSCHDGNHQSTAKLTNMKALLAANPNHHGPIRERDCSGCHQPHGSAHFRLLVADYPKAFYAPYKPENFALCFQCHDPALTRDARTTTLTDFRDGDRNLHYLHVNKVKKGRTCRACHETHASPLPNHIRVSVPFGKWELPINYKKSATGGSCAPGCHSPKTYARSSTTADNH